MTDHPRSAQAEMDLEARSSRLTRRRLIAGSGAAAALAPLAALGQEASPVASPAASPVADVNIDVFRAICFAAAGVAELPDEPLAQLRDLILADPPSAAGLGAMLAASGGLDFNALPEGADVAVTNILEFWYLGNFNGEPVENRADLFTGLVSFQTLPYVTIPAVCKAYGYWAMEVDLPERG